MYWTGNLGGVYVILVHVLFRYEIEISYHVYVGVVGPKWHRGSCEPSLLLASKLSVNQRWWQTCETCLFGLPYWFSWVTLFNFSFADSVWEKSTWQFFQYHRILLPLVWKHWRKELLEGGDDSGSSLEEQICGSVTWSKIGKWTSGWATFWSFSLLQSINFVADWNVLVLPFVFLDVSDEALRYDR